MEFIKKEAVPVFLVDKVKRDLFLICTNKRYLGSFNNIAMNVFLQRVLKLDALSLRFGVYF